MKRKIKYLLTALAVVVMLNSCTVWEKQWDEIIPLPEVDDTITVDPWDDAGGNEDIGK